MAKRKKKRGSSPISKIVFFLLIMAVLAALAYITKPSDEICKIKAAAQARDAVKGDVNESNAVIDNVLSKIVRHAIRVEDKVFYKSISYVFSGKDKTIGWGAFGMVYVDANK